LKAAVVAAESTTSVFDVEPRADTPVDIDIVVSFIFVLL